MKLKRFINFINEDLKPEEFERDMEMDEFDSPEDLKKELGEEDLREDDFDFEDDDHDLEEEDFEVDNDDYEEGLERDLVGSAEEEEESVPEEGSEYEGTKKMNQLAEMLGTEVVENKIEYQGKTINFFSETNKFHIGKEKFETPQEVVEYLQSQDVEESSPEVVDEEEMEMELQESRRYIKKFN